MRAVNGPCTGSPCTVLSVRARYRLVKTPPVSPCLQRKPSCSLLTCSPWHSTFMHTCTIYVCTLHAASALISALCVSSKAFVMLNGYVSESLTAGHPRRSSPRVKSHNTHQHSNPTCHQHSNPWLAQQRPSRVMARVHATNATQYASQAGRAALLHRQHLHQRGQAAPAPGRPVIRKNW